LPIRLWIDVEDLFEYARGNKRPSGIQRLAFEIYRAMHLRIGDTGLAQFIRHAVPRNSFRTVPWNEVADLFGMLTDLQRASPVAPATSTRAVQRSIHDSHTEDRIDATEGDAMPTI
jgi:hypothetical protein